MAKLGALILAGLLLAGLAGLAGCGGGNAQTHVEARGTTLGKELMDLKEARDKGVISDQEYQTLREKLLRD